MIQKIKNYFVSTLMIVSMAAPVPLMAVATAGATAGVCNAVSQGIANGVEQATTGSTTGDCAGTDANGGAIGKAAKGIVQVFSLIVGIAAVIMIIYGGFRYITSGGDSGRVGNAKNTLIYAIVGLIVVALAQLIVHFVLNQSTAITTS